ncbi:MAG: bifunctional chorismate mutase/prephenate dehydrogenase [Gemmatimonadetes bacterium]|nr:bifunctional chorismate mutase/prephenate dehydrogenase [Gemmatimonadota bacterium]
MSRRPKLDRLRARIREIDRRILELADERVRLAEEVGQWKLENSLPVRDFETEREVLANAERICLEFDLEPTLGREIIRALIGGAVKVQEEIRERRFHGSKRRIGILGGRGKMGAWMARYLYSRGHDVLVHDIAGRLPGFRNTSRLEKVLAECEVLIVAVPLADAKDFYRTVRRAKPGGIIVDLFSLKSPILTEIERARAAGLRVTSLHPLFGPDVYLLSDCILLLASCGDGDADRSVADLFAGTSLEIVTMTVEEHDRAMGLVLGLSHGVNFVFTEALARSGLSAAALRKVATTTYKKQSATASEVARENPRLYYDIQHLNRYSPEVFALFEQSLATFRKAATSRDPRAFTKLVERGRAFFDEER